MPLDVELRRQQLASVHAHLRVNMRAASAVRHGLDRAEQILAAARCEEAPVALEVFVLLVMAAETFRVDVNAVHVALPDLHGRAAHRLAIRPEDAPAEIRDLAGRGSDRVIHDEEIVVRIERQMVGVERPLGLARCGCERGGKCAGHGEERAGRGKLREKTAAGCCGDGGLDVHDSETTRAQCGTPRIKPALSPVYFFIAPARFTHSEAGQLPNAPGRQPLCQFISCLRTIGTPCRKAKAASSDWT